MSIENRIGLINNIRTIHMNKKMQNPETDIVLYLEEDPNESKVITKLPINIWSKPAFEKILTLNQQNILKLLEIIDRSASFYVISDHYEYSLHHILFETYDWFNPADIVEFLIQIFDGIIFLHQSKIFHSYLNSQDVFVKNRSTIKIGGFYFSEILGDKDVSNISNRPLYYECGSEEKQNLGFRYDSWCVGLILYELCFRQKAVDLLHTNLGPYWQKNLPELPIELNRNFGKIYKKLLIYDFNERHTVEDISCNELVYRSLINWIESSKGFFTFNHYKIVQVLNINKPTYKVENTITHEERVIKLRDSRNTPAEINREIEIHVQSRENKYLAQYIENFISDNFICLVFEYANKHSLKDYLYTLVGTGTVFDPKVLHDWIGQLLSGLNILQRIGIDGIVHRNIKPSNIIIIEDENKQARLKYIDFYLSRQLNQPINVLSLNLIYSEYSAPEFVLQETYDKLIDVWSLGCIIYEMITLKKAFKTLNNAKESFENPPSLPSDSIYHSLVKRMLVRNPYKRATAKDCLNIWKDLRVPN